MLSAADLVFTYQGSGFQLRIPQFQAAAGEKVAIIGPSGSGKTTLLHLFCGIRQPENGSILIGGFDVAQASAAARRRFRVQRIGLIFQEFELLEYLTVLENILIACRLTNSLPVNAARQEAARVLAGEVGLTDDKLRRYPHQLSHGERQRVAICRALLVDPPLVLADEPTGNLDPSNKRRILELLVQHTAVRGATLIAATHDHQLLDAFDRVVEMEQLRDGK